MTTLYFVANTLNYMVVGTGNRSELSIGYFTKYGDGGVDLLPIGDLLKSEVREAARDARRSRAGHRESAERRALARADRRSGDGIHLRRARELPDEGSRNGVARAGDADRAADARRASTSGRWRPHPERTDEHHAASCGFRLQAEAPRRLLAVAPGQPAAVAQQSAMPDAGAVLRLPDRHRQQAGALGQDRRLHEAGRRARPTASASASSGKSTNGNPFIALEISQRPTR